MHTTAACRMTSCYDQSLVKRQRAPSPKELQEFKNKSEAVFKIKLFFDENTWKWWFEFKLLLDILYNNRPICTLYPQPAVSMDASTTASPPAKRQEGRRGEEEGAKHSRLLHISGWRRPSSSETPVSSGPGPNCSMASSVWKKTGCLCLVQKTKAPPSDQGSHQVP